MPSAMNSPYQRRTKGPASKITGEGGLGSERSNGGAAIY
jgi:hypothetical protein